MSKAHLGFGFSSRDTGNTLRALLDVGWIRPQPPQVLWLNQVEATPGNVWLERLFDVEDATAIWDDRTTRLVINSNGLVAGEISGVDITVENVLTALDTVPFTVASFPSIHLWDGYDAPSFGRGHDPHGWGCAFKGEGHDRLVSRRWLGVGPWRVLRGKGDLTLVQFHDIEASASVALEQAKVGHPLIGIHKLGGFLQTNYQFRTDLKALYSLKQHALLFVVKGSPLDSLALRDAAAAVRFQPFGTEKRVERVVFVFIDKAEAEKHLPTLWRYGFEVRVIGDDGVERRIDQDYQPTLDKPPWVTKLGRDDSIELIA